MPRQVTLLPGRYAVCRLDAASSAAAESVVAVTHPPALRSVTQTPREVSVVCPETEVPAAATAIERGWRAFEVEGPIPFTETGVIAGITSVLAANGIPVFAISTYDTDYVLVPEAHLERAQEILGPA